MRPTPTATRCQYQWRVTGGSIDNRNASSTVWTLPASRGIHFAYVTVSDGRGGYVEQQYAVNADRLDLLPPARTPIVRAAPAVTDVEGATNRLRFVSGDDTRFQPAAAGPPQARTVFLPDVQVQLFEQGTGALVFGGITDLSGELDLPKLVAGRRHQRARAKRHAARTAATSSLTIRPPFAASPRADRRPESSPVRSRGLAAGDTGHENAFFGIRSARRCNCALPVARRRAGARQPVRRLPDQCRGAGSRRAPARRA
jgi:hypothetical protein